MNMRMKQIVNQFDFRFSAAKLATYGDILFLRICFSQFEQKSFFWVCFACCSKHFVEFF